MNGPGAMFERGVARAVLVLSLLLFVPGLLDPFNAPRAIVLRVVGLPLLAYAAARWTWRPRMPAPAFRPMDLAVVAWVTVSLLATVFSVSSRLSLAGELQQREGLLTTLGLAGLYASLRHSHRRAEHVRVTLNVVLAGVALAAGYALLQCAGWDPIAWGGTLRMGPGAGAAVRPFAMLGNPILLGAVLGPALGVVTVRLLATTRRTVLWAALFAGLASVILATLSRGAWLAAACAIACALAGGAAFGSPRPGRRAAFALAAAMAVPVVVALVFLREPLIARAGEGLLANEGSAFARREIARSALALWHGRPWLGSGPDTFGLSFPRVQTLAYGGGLWNGLPLQAHSVALQVLATTGVLGALAGLLWIAALLGPLARERVDAPQRRERLELAVGCASLLACGLLNHVGIVGAVLFVAFSAMAQRAPGDAPAAAEPRAARALALPALAAAIALAGVLAWRARPEWVALAHAGRARECLQQSVGATVERRQDLQAQAGDEAARAVACAPGEDELLRLSCTADLALGREALARGDLRSAAAVLERAVPSAERAVALEPLRAANFQVLGNALVLQARVTLVARPEAGEAAANVARIDAAFTSAQRLAPLDALLLMDRARGELELRRAAEARATAERLVRLYPDAADGHTLLAAAQWLAGGRREAAQSLRAALRGRWLDERGTGERAAREFLRGIQVSDSIFP